MPVIPSVARNLAVRPSSSRGFTLIEILIALGLLLIVFALLFVPISSSFGYFRTATARADAQTIARTALDSMARELSEAMAVQLDMYDNTMIAFIPPLRVNPDDPNSEIVTPPRPDWNRAIRYWQALTDPTRNYNPGAYLEPSNMLFLARTVVPDPFTTNDPWNRWNQAWANDFSARAIAGLTNWAPVPRAVSADFDVRWNWQTKSWVMDKRNATLQPGYPYLYVISKYGAKLPVEGVREYRTLAVALTPNAPEYDVPQLTFTPTVVSGERLQRTENADGENGSLYRARYPLWRLGEPFTGWSSLPAEFASLKDLKPDGPSNPSIGDWARDPFLTLWRYRPSATPGVGIYAPQGAAAFDPRTRTLRVFDFGRGAVHDSSDAGLMPYLEPGNPQIRTRSRFQFSVDWVDGSLRCDYPETRRINDPNAPPPSDEWSAAVKAIPGSATGAQGIPLGACWENYTLGEELRLFLVPDSVVVKRVLPATSSGPTATPSRVLAILEQVSRKPRDGRDEFRLGDSAAVGAAVPYGWIELPANIGKKPDGVTANPVTDQTFVIEFRWRSNGVLIPEYKDGQPTNAMIEKPDIITAYYRTAAVLDIGLTVSRADPSAEPGKRIAQSAYLTRRVKLHNLLREIRYAEK